MITFTIIIKEVPDKAYSIDVNPSQKAATVNEMRVATLFNASLQVFQDYIRAKTINGGEIASQDPEAIRDLADQMISRFEAPEN